MALGFGRKKHNGETEDETPLEAGVLDESFGLDEEHQAESGDEPSEFGDGSASEFRDEPATLEPPQHAPAETPRPRPVFLQGNGDGRDPKREERPEPPAPAPFSGRGPVFVVVSETEHEAGSVTQFADAADARAHIELLVESGTTEADIAVYSGERVALQVTRRPLVTLTLKDD